MEQHDRKTYVSNNIRKSFSFAEEATGYVAGWKRDGEKICMAISTRTDFFLSGLEVLGIFCLVYEESLPENELLTICKQCIASLMVELDDPLVLFVYKEKNEDTVKITAKLFSTYYSTFSDLKLMDLQHNSALLLQAKGKLPVFYEASTEIDTLKENIELAIERLRSVVHSEVAAFLLHNSSIMLTNFNDLMKSDSSMKCKDLLKFIQDNDITEKKKFKKDLRRKCPVDFSISIQITGDAALENTVNHSLVIHCQRREFQCVSLYLPLDVLIVCVESTPTYEIFKQFTSAIEQQLEKMSQCLLTYAESMEYVSPVPYHFYPDFWDVPVTIIYPLNKSDEELENQRRTLHKQLLLPMDRPFLKKLNAYCFSDVTSSGCLINPHEGLNPSGVVDGKTALVQGRYSYHHYMQDHVNDNGWGCAYRSLQTIISWFKFQGYTGKDIPSHAEIQQALVDIGDKPQSFVGSKQWIGSQEVSFCLDYLIKIQSKILFVNCGADMANKGRELYNHFRDQGTPIMIGGGVLAHTILGVDFNQNTGDLKFLILDPHYTGGEDLSIIQNKGWCGWKDTLFWDQMAFYNLCLPQRPQQI